MTALQLDTVAKNLAAVLAELEVRGLAFENGWLDRDFLRNEWEWRKNRDGFREWLSSPEPDLRVDWSSWFTRGGNELYWRNRQPLQKAWDGATPEDRKSVHDALKRALNLTAESSVDERRGVAEAYFSALKKLASVPGLDKDEQRVVGSEYHVRTVPLSAAAPGVFPFLFPTLVTGAVTKRVFGDLDRDPAGASEAYVRTADAFAMLADALERAKDFGPTPREPNARVRMAAAWLVEANSRWSRPTEVAAKLLRDKKHVILQGPPGTGKTWIAERIRRGLAGSERTGASGNVVPLLLWLDMSPDERKSVGLVYEFVQFHASYDYEDFVRGFRPRKAEGGLAFELEDGPFAAIVSAAIEARKTGVGFLLTIDEINRADLARVLGECIYLLDRRIDDGEAEDVDLGKKPGAVRLRYTPAGNGKMRSTLWIPSNLYIVGTMNTADRSTAIVDNALRRRFLFVDVKPSTDVIRTVWKSRNRGDGQVPEEIEGYVEVLDRLNGGDGAKGLIQDERYHIGHSFFLGETLSDVRCAIQYQVLPLLREYKDAGRLVEVDGYGLSDVERDLTVRL